MSPFHRATFFITAAKMSDLNFASTAEVAFAGRSNAGKSSAINTLANFRRLAFTSKMPGRTQQLNYFALGADRYMVDLPGYGYAKVARTERERWGRFIGSYLQVREPLAGLVLIMDARHPLTDLDYQLLEWFGPTGKPVHALLTKSDKLSKLECAATLRKASADLKALSPLYSASLFSSMKKTGIEDAEAVILPWLRMDDEALAQIGREKEAARLLAKSKRENRVEGENWRDTPAQSAAKAAIKDAAEQAAWHRPAPKLPSKAPERSSGKPPARASTRTARKEPGKGPGKAPVGKAPAKAPARAPAKAPAKEHKGAYKTGAYQGKTGTTGKPAPKPGGTPNTKSASRIKPVRPDTRKHKK